jgi:hypothetical protein
MPRWWNGLHSRLKICHSQGFVGSSPTRGTTYMLQLNPMIPVYSLRHKMEGYAFLVIDYSQEHDLLFTVALDNGEIWTLSNKEIRFCKNISLDRETIAK